MIEVSEESPVVLSVPIVKLGNSKTITIQRSWGLGIKNGDILTVMVKCQDGQARYQSFQVKERQRCLRITLPTSWPINYGDEYELRIIKYIPQDGGAEPSVNARSRD